jgi:hypothetical protein
MYRGVVEAAQSFEGGPKQDWGVAIAWRTGALRGCAEVDCVEVDGAFGPLPVAVLRAFVVCWGEEALFVCAHLDGEGCPPSVLRSRQQLAQIAEQVMREASRSGVRRVVWGGDFNQPTTSPAIGAAAVEQGLRIVSGQPDRPTCYVSVVFGRIDHVLSSGCDSVATEIPRCPNPTHRIKAVPGYYYGQVMLDCLCITSPPTATPGVLPRVGAGILALLLIWLWLPVLLVVVLCPLCMRCTHRDRCAWGVGQRSPASAGGAAALRNQGGADRPTSSYTATGSCGPITCPMSWRYRRTRTIRWGEKVYQKKWINLFSVEVYISGYTVYGAQRHTKK